MTMPAVGALLSEYRRSQRLSQLELGLLADVSSRHISFIETGKTTPSRTMLMKLADVLQLPHRDSNLLLNSGGFVSAYTEQDLASAEMQPVRQALELMLANHDPYPALVMDSNWNLLMANQAQQLLFSAITDDQGQLPTRNLLEAVFREDCFRPLITNWDIVASHLLRRLRRQLLAFGNTELDALYQTLLALAPPADWQQPQAAVHDGPMLTLEVTLGEQALSLFTTLTKFGTALDVGMEDLLIESYFPANQATRAFFTPSG